MMQTLRLLVGARAWRWLWRAAACFSLVHRTAKLQTQAGESDPLSLP